MAFEDALIWLGLFSATGFFVLPFLVDQFSKSEFLDSIMRSGSFIVSLMLMTVNWTLVLAIVPAATYGNNLDNLIRMNMFIFGTAGWLMSGYMVFKSLKDAILMWRIKKMKKRMGEDDDD